MSLDIRIQPLAFDVRAPDEEAREAGAEAAVSIGIFAGLTLPFQPAPGAPPVQVPLGVVRFDIKKEDAEAFGGQILETAEGLPETSDLVVASSLAGVDQEADRLAKLKGE